MTCTIIVLLLYIIADWAGDVVGVLPEHRKRWTSVILCRLVTCTLEEELLQEEVTKRASRQMQPGPRATHIQHESQFPPNLLINQI